MLTSVAMAGQAETPRAEHSFVNSKGFPTLITDSATEGLHVLSLGQKKCRLPRAVRVASTATDSSVMCLHMLTEMCLDLHVTLHEGLQVGIKQMLQIVHIDGPQVQCRGTQHRVSERSGSPHGTHNHLMPCGHERAHDECMAACMTDGGGTPCLHLTEAMPLSA